MRPLAQSRIVGCSDAANAAPARGNVGLLAGEDARALRLMRFIAGFREARWGVVQPRIFDLGVDFVAHASEHFLRLR